MATSDATPASTPAAIPQGRARAMTAARHSGHQPRESLDARGWCPECRAAVIARARPWAIAAGLLAGVASLVAVVLLVSPTLRIPVVVWVVVAGAIYFVTFRVVRRVAFEVIRGRGVPPPRSGDGA